MQDKTQEKSNYPYFHSGINFIAVVAAIVNVILAIYFISIEFYAGTTIQTIGALIFILLKIWFDRGADASLIFGIMLMDIIVHSLLNAYLMGISSGYLLYIIISPIIILLNPYWSIKKVSLYFMLLLVVFIAGFLFLLKQEVLIPLPEDEVQTVFYLNLSLSVGGGFSSLLFFKYINILNRNKLIAYNNELSNKNEEIKKQYRKQKILLKEIHHRVKNNLQVISSMLSLQKHKLNDQAMIDILENSQSRIHAISIIHQKLFQQEELAVVNINFYLQDLAESLNHLNPNIDCRINAIDLSIHLDIAVPLGLITAEALSNSYKHAFKNDEKGIVDIQLNKKNDDLYQLSITDSGIGFPQNFELEDTKGLGMEIIQTLSEQINAKVYFGTNETGAFNVIEFQVPEVTLIG